LQELAAEQRAHAETRQKLLAEQSAAAVQNLIHEAYHGIPEGENGNDWPDGTPEEVKRCIAWTGCPAALSCWHYLKERPRRVTALCEACTEASSRMQKQKEKPSP
jgi:hypothetical protein